MKARVTRPALLAFALVAILALGVLPSSAAAAPLALDAKILVLSADGTEPGLASIVQTLEYLGTPYTLWVASQRPGGLTGDQLATSTRGFYQGVILATGDLAYSPDGGTTWVSALSSAEWAALQSYEKRFGVREVSWYTFPAPSHGFSSFTVADTSSTPIEAFLTTAGKTIFPYINAAPPLVIREAFAYLARPLDANTRPLIVDRAGNTLGAWVRTHPDGRETLALTFDGNQHLVHTLALAYGLVNWVTKGLFLGERHVYLSAQVDDLLIDDDIFTGGTYRITASDLAVVIAWQNRVRRQPVTANVQLHMAFNGEGTSGIYANDTLTSFAKKNRALFKWINHTYTHRLLDDVAYSTAWDEISLNHQTAREMRFTDAGLYSKLNLVTPEISGLSNPAALNAAWDFGVRYVVSDTSRPGMNNPSPNAGIYNAFHPGILMIPRYPNSLFYNVSTPAEWIAEYNYLYGVAGIIPPPAGWGRDFTYAEILDFESEVLLRDLIRGDANPWMFHQSNLRAYDGTHTLLGDLLDRTLTKYRELFKVPVTTPTMDALGQKFANRMAYNAAGVSATIEPGIAITLRADRAAIVPVTGLRTTNAELYAGQYISYVRLNAGQALRLPLR
jgi:hypothetical protein